MPVPDSLTTVSAVTSILGINDTTENAALSTLIPLVSALITESLGRAFLLSTNAANPITEFYSGMGDPELVLRHRPVQSVTAVYQDAVGYYGEPSGAFGSTTQLIAGSDFVLRRDQPDGTSRSGILLRLNGVWPGLYQRDAGALSSYLANGRGNIKVVYTAGWTAIPGDLQLAAIRVIGKCRNSKWYGAMVQSEGVEDEHYSLEAAKSEINMGLLAHDCAPILARYRSYAIGGG